MDVSPSSHVTENYELSVRSHSGLPPSNRQPMDSYIFFFIIINIFSIIHFTQILYNIEEERKKKSGDIYITLCL